MLSTTAPNNSSSDLESKSWSLGLFMSLNKNWGLGVQKGFSVLDGVFHSNKRVIRNNKKTTIK